MSRIIIGIHGLGNKPEKRILKEWWKKSMKEGLKSIGKEISLPKFEMVYWADLMYDKPLDPKIRDTESPYYIEEKYTRAPQNFHVEDHSLRMSIIDFLGKQLNEIFLNEDLTLNYTYITDFIVSKYFRELEIYYKDDCEDGNTAECRIKEKILLRLLNTLKKYKDDEIMLISHSMGTIIAYDVLTFLASDIKIHSLVTMGSPLGLPVIISKIASEYKRRTKGEAHMVTPPGVYKNWFNFSDILDKIAFNFKLGDDFTENNYGVKPVDFQVVNNYQFKGEHNPHKSFGYLRAIEFAKVLNDFITFKN